MKIRWQLCEENCVDQCSPSHTAGAVGEDGSVAQGKEVAIVAGDEDLTVTVKKDAAEES